MNYVYKCNLCAKTEEIKILTHDIVDKYGRINQSELTKRMYEPRKCECGGELKKIITHIQEPLWFDMGIGKGKISQRFK